jgi:hypothetical protein
MHKQIFNKYKTLGEYHKLSFPIARAYESMAFYHKNKTTIDFEGAMYSQIHHDRIKLGGNERIHKIKTNGTKVST